MMVFIDITAIAGGAAAGGVISLSWSERSYWVYPCLCVLSVSGTQEGLR